MVNGLFRGWWLCLPITMCDGFVVFPSDWKANLIDGAQCVWKLTPSIPP